MLKIGVMTPVDHIEGIPELIDSLGTRFDVPEYKTAARDYILKNEVNVLICNPNKQSFIIDEEFLEGTRIVVINSCSTGLNHIDMDYCKKMDIEVQHHKNDIKLLDQLPSTAELAFSLLTNIIRKVSLSKEHVLEGGWNYTEYMGHQLRGMNIGIIGYGRLGKMMYKFCDAFDANLKIYDPYLDMSNIEHHKRDSFMLNHYSSNLSNLFQWATAISLHIHVTNETKELVNKDLLSLVKDLYLVNTSRGAVVNEQDIIEALKNGNLAGYGTDVLIDEYTHESSPIVDLMRDNYNVVITPHVGGMTYEGQHKAYHWSINKLKDVHLW